MVGICLVLAPVSISPLLRVISFLIRISNARHQVYPCIRSLLLFVLVVEVMCYLFEPMMVQIY